MNTHFIKQILCALVMGSCFFCALPAQARESEAAIREKLQTLGQRLVQIAAKNVVPHKTKKAVKVEGNTHVAYYVEIDTTSLRTELRPGETSGYYVGLIKYKENHYQCRANSKQAALKADCYRTRSRNLTEIISYDGKWRY